MTAPCRALVRPITAVPARTSWPLSPIDRSNLKVVINGTWIFDADLDANTLKHGLARLLDAYPMLCGRVTSGERVEWVADSGVPVLERTDKSLSVADFGPTCVDVSRVADRYPPASIRQGRAPLMTVTLTHLRDGCVLGICCSHGCLDGNGFYSMARNLGRAATNAAFARPSFDRPPDESLQRARADVARRAQAAGWHRLTPLDAVRFALARPAVRDRVFVARFAPEALAAGKAGLARSSGHARLSTNSAVLAHVAHRVVTLLGLIPGSRFAVSTAIDLRERVRGVSETFARNALSRVTTPPMLAGASAAEVAARVHELLEPFLAKPSAELESFAALETEVAAHRLPYSTFPVSGLLGKRPSLLWTNSFWKFPVYDVDFGDASRPIRPARAIPHNLGDAIVLWPAPPSVGGIELYFSGALARALARFGREDPWWAALGRFDA